MRDRNLLREREASDNAPSARAPQTPAISGVDRSLCIKGHPADQPRRLRPGHGLVHRVEACSQDVARVQALTAHGVRIADRCLRRLCTGLLPEPRFLPTRGKPQPQRSDVTSGHRHAHAFGAGGWAPNAWSASCRKADAASKPNAGHHAGSLRGFATYSTHTPKVSRSTESTFSSQRSMSSAKDSGGGKAAIDSCK